MVVHELAEVQVHRRVHHHLHWREVARGELGVGYAEEKGGLYKYTRKALVPCCFTRTNSVKVIEAHSSSRNLFGWSSGEGLLHPPVA